MTRCKYTDEVHLCLGVNVVTPIIDGVEQPQGGGRYKPFVYSVKTCLSMADSEKKVQNETAQVKGLKGGHTSGWVKVPSETEDKLYLDHPINKLNNVGLQRRANYMSWMLY